MSSPHIVPHREASTDAVPPHERLAFWDEYNSSELIGLRCSSYTEQGLDARQRNFDLGSLKLADIAGNAHVIERTPDLLRRYPRQSIFVAVVVEGEIFLYQNGRCISARPGDILIYPTWEPYLCGYARPARQFIVDLPSSLVLGDDRLPRPDGPIKIDGGLGGGRALGSELEKLLRSFAARPLASDAARVTNRMHAVCHALLTLPHDLNRIGASALVRRLRAEAFIVEHLNDEDLDAAAVARHVCLSPRHLNRLFTQDGCTVTQWIWEQRLVLAHRLLADPAQRRQTIADVAHRCGFASAAHFTSAFKARYNQTPSQHRHNSVG
jgi:AraC-like DNA-binding protein